MMQLKAVTTQKQQGRCLPLMMINFRKNKNGGRPKNSAIKLMKTIKFYLLMRNIKQISIFGKQTKLNDRNKKDTDAENAGTSEILCKSLKQQ